MKILDINLNLLKKSTKINHLFSEHYSRLREYLEPLNNGFFVEAGANDGTFFSYTYPLELKHGWKGILIEPSQNALGKCRKNRSSSNLYVQAALVSSSYPNTEVFGDFDGNYMSSANGNRLGRSSINISVPAKTLTSIIKESGVPKIDFLSLDVEGYEYESLGGIDFDIIRPRYVLVEIYKSEYNKIFKLLNKNNYTYIDNISNYTKVTNPLWDGTHNDYLFKTS